MRFAHPPYYLSNVADVSRRCDRGGRARFLGPMIFLLRVVAASPMRTGPDASIGIYTGAPSHSATGLATWPFAIFLKSKGSSVVPKSIGAKRGIR